MKKITLYIILFFGISQSIYAQRFSIPQNLPFYDNKKMHFGFTVGINSLDFKIKYNSDIIFKDSLIVLESQNQKGFNLGIVSNFRLGKYTDFRFIPSLVFGERHLLYTFSDNNSIIRTEKKIIESTLLDFPLHLKYKSARYNNFRSYVLIGIKYSMDIASQEDIDDQGIVIIKLKKNDILGEIGFGMDFYLEYFKFSPQIKLSTGVLNLLSKDNSVYTTSVKNLYTNGWMLSFTFE